MKRFVLYAALGIGALVLIFLLLVVAVLLLADDESGRERLAQKVGYAYGMFLFLLIVVLFGFGLYKLIQLSFFNDRDPHEKVAGDKDAPIDRYIK
jgi:membrane protease YdiL (CAAX protease family)